MNQFHPPIRKALTVQSPGLGSNNFSGYGSGNIWSSILILLYAQKGFWSRWLHFELKPTVTFCCIKNILIRFSTILRLSLTNFTYFFFLRVGEIHCWHGTKQNTKISVKSMSVLIWFGLQISFYTMRKSCTAFPH